MLKKVAITDIIRIFAMQKPVSGCSPLKRAIMLNIRSGFFYA